MGDAVERTSPPRDTLGALIQGSPRIAFAGDHVKVLLDAFRLWPQGMQFEISTIETLDLYPAEFDMQSLTGQHSGQGLQVLVHSRAAVDDPWATRHISAGASETSAGGTHRRRHITTWTPLDVTSVHGVKITASWDAAGMTEHSIEVEGPLLRSTLQSCV